MFGGLVQPTSPLCADDLIQLRDVMLALIRDQVAVPTVITMLDKGFQIDLKWRAGMHAQAVICRVLQSRAPEVQVVALCQRTADIPDLPAKMRPREEETAYDPCAHDRGGARRRRGPARRLRSRG
jgi:hypothetical protein